jgi:hypothetical protein
MGGKGMRPAFNYDPKYTVTMSTKGEWTGGPPRTPPIVKEPIWYTDGSRMWRANWAGA